MQKQNYTEQYNFEFLQTIGLDQIFCPVLLKEQMQDVKRYFLKETLQLTIFDRHSKIYIGNLQTKSVVQAKVQLS